MITFFDLMRNIVNTLNTVVRSESQNLTEEEKTIVRDNIGVPSQNDFVVVQTTVANMKADMEYVPIEIIKIYNNIGTVEKGTEVKEMLVTWELNKDPEEQTLGGYKFKVPNADRSSTVPMEGRTSVELVVTDERGTTAAKSTGYNAYNGVYYGAAAIPETLDSAFVLSLREPVLTSTRARTITVNAADGQYIWYALPVGLGKCTFTVGGFAGGFTLLDTIEFTNRKGYTEPYYIYRSENMIPGETKVVIS